MGQLKIFIPDDLEEKIRATGRPTDEVVLDLIKDRFQEHDETKTGTIPESKSDQNLAGRQKRVDHEIQRAKIDQALAEEEKNFNSIISEYEEKGLAKGKGKETLESVKTLEASLQDMIQAHKENERIVNRIEETVGETNSTAAEGKKAKSDTEERIKKSKAPINEGR